MARATLGIAMGAAGSDAAIETADVASMSDDLSKLPWLMRHSTRTLSIVRQNITLSLGRKTAAAVEPAMAVGNHMSPSTFRQDFRALTGVSPCSSRSKLRLQEVRQLMLTENRDAGSAAGRV